MAAQWELECSKRAIKMYRQGRLFGIIKTKVDNGIAFTDEEITKFKLQGYLGEDKKWI